jgi:glutamine synthetase
MQATLAFESLTRGLDTLGRLMSPGGVDVARPAVAVHDDSHSAPPDPVRLARQLSRRGVEGIALTYVDNSGITRVKAIPTDHLERIMSTGVGMSPVFDVFLLDDSITASRTSTGPTGDLRLYPDLRRLVSLAAQPGWAWAPVERRSQLGEIHPLCQRSFAARMATKAFEAGISALMSFEVEWTLDAGSGDEVAPAAHGPAYGMTRVIERSSYLRDLLVALAAEAISVEQVHPEYAAGQFEVSMAPKDPVGAADDSVLARLTLRGVGLNHGLRTSFSPSVVAGQVGNGGHIHLSLWRDNRNLFADGDGPYGITIEGEGFAAGVLRELPALLVIGCPSVASYLRLVPQHWAGVFQTWGLENREAALRLVIGTAGLETRLANLEVKCFDLTANPYLLVGAVLAAGLAGIRDGLRLPPEVTVDPAILSPAELVESRATRLPESLPEALEHYEASTILAEALGEALHETIAAVRRAEVTLFAQSTPEEVAAATRWRH